MASDSGTWKRTQAPRRRARSDAILGLRGRKRCSLDPHEYEWQAVDEDRGGSGGGHGCYAAAADLSEAGHEVRLWRRDAAALAPVVEAGTIGLKDAHGARDVGIALATADIGAALRGAELIVVPSPAIAQDDIARAMAPHLRTARSCSCRRAPSAAS